MSSPLKAWVRALERTAPIERAPTTTLPVVVEGLAARFGDAAALSAPDGGLSYLEMAALLRRVARWSLAGGLRPGDAVALMLPNCPAYLPLWLGLTRAGIRVALINTQLSGKLLAHAIGVVAPRALIAGGRCLHAASEARALLDPHLQIFGWNSESSDLPRLEHELLRHSAAPLADSECALPRLDDCALYIYTSGTTGLPKAAQVSHFRLMQWSHWFAGMMDTGPADRMYDCLPLYHSVGGVVATFATLLGGGTVVLRERFSAREFWRDLGQERCTLFQYIGELCRYLLKAPFQQDERAHALRLCCGNGLREEVWRAFQERFRIPQILEYYASTEGSFSLYNCEGRPGAIGRIPSFLTHRMRVALIRVDPADGITPLRGPDGLCMRCAPGEPGEALGALSGPSAGRFEGYQDAESSRHKILQDVFTQGDAWYRTGDLLRQDAQGFYYFVDRLGDTFRWKGENVSTTEVGGVLAEAPGVLEVAVYGVQVPYSDGRAGMAALVTGPDFDPDRLHAHVLERLPDYARPVFLRLVAAIELTGTFKQRKAELAREGFDPGRINDPLLIEDRAAGRYRPLDGASFTAIAAGTLRL